MKSVCLTLLIAATCCASISAFASGQETLAQHAAAKGVKVGHISRFNVHAGKAIKAARKATLAVTAEAGHHAHFKARKVHNGHAFALGSLRPVTKLSAKKGAQK